MCEGHLEILDCQPVPSSPTHIPCHPEQTITYKITSSSTSLINLLFATEYYYYYYYYYYFYYYSTPEQQLLTYSLPTCLRCIELS